MSFVARNHPQQVAERGALDDIDDRRTPDDLFDECCRAVWVRDGFDLDAAANAESSRGEQFYDIAADGLTMPWFGCVWLNPPYSNLEPWIMKTLEELRRPGGCNTVVALLPANRTEQAWWQDHIEPLSLAGRINPRFLRGRRRFDRPGWEKPAKGDRPPFGLVLIKFERRRIDMRPTPVDWRG